MVRRIAIALLASTVLAHAQDVANHSIPIGKGPGVIGWSIGGPCTAGQSLVWSNNTSDPVCATATGGGGVTSVNNSDSTITVAPTTGVTFFSLNLAHANTWTALQTFNTAGAIVIGGATSGAITLAVPAAAGTNTATLPANTGTIAETNIAQTWTGNQVFSNAVTTGNLTMTGGIVAKVRSASTASVSATATDYFLCLDPTANAITVNLPGSPTTGQTFLIKDCTGQSGAHSITVLPAAGNIDGAANSVISVPYQSIAVTYTGAQWSLN